MTRSNIEHSKALILGFIMHAMSHASSSWVSCWTNRIPLHISSFSTCQNPALKSAYTSLAKNRPLIALAMRKMHCFKKISRPFDRFIFLEFYSDSKGKHIDVK